MASEAIERARGALSERKHEIEEELRQIERALSSLSGTGRPRGRPQSRSKPRGTPKRRRRSGGRSDQALRLIGRNPGITVAELAAKMKLGAPNYLYRILPTLETEGKIIKEGKGYRMSA